MLKGIDLKLEDVERYVDKFKDNGAVMKMLEVIVKDKGFYITGKSFYRENEYLEQVKNLANQVITRLEPHFSPIGIKIAKNLLQGKISEREEVNDIQVHEESSR